MVTLGKRVISGGASPSPTASPFVLSVAARFQFNRDFGRSKPLPYSDPFVFSVAARFQFNRDFERSEPLPYRKSVCFFGKATHNKSPLQKFLKRG